MGQTEHSTNIHKDSWPYLGFSWGHGVIDATNLSDAIINIDQTPNVLGSPPLNQRM